MTEHRAVEIPGTGALYSPAVIAGEFVFVAGQVGYDPIKKAYYGDTIEAQTRGALENMKAVLEKAGCAMSSVVKTNIFLTDVRDFDKVNEIYCTYFKTLPPARSCVQVAGIPKGALIEIEAVALLGSGN